MERAGHNPGDGKGGSVIDKEEARTYALGQSSGLDEAAALLMSHATEQWALGRDDKIADRLRSLSHVLQTMAEKRHPGCPDTATTPALPG